MGLKVRPEDYPEGSAVRRQLEAAAAQTEAIVGRLKSRIGQEAVQAAAVSRPEQQLQMELIRTADAWPLQMLLTKEWPEEIRHRLVGDYLIHVPNGGYRSAAEAGIFKAMGVRAGVWDLFFLLPIASPYGPAPGLWMELKAGDNALTTNQTKFGATVAALGYRTEEVRSGVEFQQAIEKYLAGARPW